MRKNSLAIIVLLVFMFASVHALEVSTIIPDKYINVNAGDDLHFQVSIKDIENAGRHDISLTYIISKDGVSIAQKREFKAIETQASFLSTINVPESTSLGQYALQVIINDNAIAQANFTVEAVSDPLGNIKTYIMILTIGIFFVGAMIWWEIHKVYRLTVNKVKR